MPIVSVKVLAGAFSKEQKERLIDGITDVFANVGGEGMVPTRIFRTFSCDGLV